MKKKLFLMCVLFTAIVVPFYGQNSREYIRNSISNWGECKNVAITKTNGDVALYGKNGYSCSCVPSGLKESLSELRQDGELIDDVQLTENGKWLILYGNNGIVYNNIPYQLEEKLKEYNENNEVITSVTFNDSGDWIVISTKRFCASDSRISTWLEDGLEEFGQLWAVCLTDDAMAAVYEKGYKFFGNVPEDLKQKLKNSGLDVFRLKIAGSSWFFANKNGIYYYNM